MLKRNITTASRTYASAAPIDRPWTVALREKPADELEVVVYDIIGPSGFFSDGVGAKDVLARLRALPNAKKISLRVNTVGGILDEAKAMVNLLAERIANGVEVVATVDGLAASAGSYLLTGASRVVMPSNAFQMIHQGRAGIRGTADEMEARSKLLRRENQQMADAYAAAAARRGKTKTAADFLALFAKGDTYLDADEAIAWGLADEKLEPLKIAACLADLDALPDEAPSALRTAAYVGRATAQVDPAPPKTPATPALPPVAATPGSTPEGNAMKVIALATIAALLGFTTEQQANAEEKDVLDALNKMKAKAEKPPEASVAVSGVSLVGVATEAEAKDKIQGLQRGVMQLLGTTAKASVEEAMAEIQTWKDDAKDKKALTKRVGELTEESRVAKRDAAIAKLSQDGALPPSRHEWARTQFATAEAVETFCQGMPKGFFGSVQEPTSSDADVSLTTEEKQICKTLGMSEAQYVEEKKLLRKAG